MMYCRECGEKGEFALSNLEDELLDIEVSADIYCESCLGKRFSTNTEDI